jgi:hypothetical protein
MWEVDAKGCGILLSVKTRSESFTRLCVHGRFALLLHGLGGAGLPKEPRTEGSCLLPSLPSLTFRTNSVLP